MQAPSRPWRSVWSLKWTRARCGRGGWQADSRSPSPPCRRHGRSARRRHSPRRSMAIRFPPGRSGSSRRPAGTTSRSGATWLGSSGTTGSGAGEAGSRLRTITQRTYSTTGVPSPLQPWLRTQTMPVWPLEVSLRPITRERACIVSPGIDQAQEAPVGVAEIGHGVERDVGHGLAEHEMECQQVLDRRRRQAVRPCERIRAVLQEARAGQWPDRGPRRRRSPSAAWRGGSPGRPGNPRRSCRYQSCSCSSPPATVAAVQQR